MIQKHETPPIFYLFPYLSFFTVPYPEVEREAAEGLAEGFGVRSPVLLGNVARMAHVQESTKHFSISSKVTNKMGSNPDLVA